MNALITGINGQDGSYLAELLINEGFHRIVGTVRRSSSPNLWRIEHLLRNNLVELRYADLTDSSSLDDAVVETAPDYIFNLAAMSDVRVSFDVPLYAAHADALGPLALFESIRRHAPHARVYQAGSSEMFGMNPDVPSHEKSLFYPGSPYAAAKVMAYHCAVNFREAFGLHISNGILFNHESERRGEEFVTRKIAIAVARIAHGGKTPLKLGSLAAKRDWGYAPEYVEAMLDMTSADTPDDYVVATGETHSVEEFARYAFDLVGLDYRDHISPGIGALQRPTDPPVLLGDPGKIEKQLEWCPQTKFKRLVEIMVEAEMEREAQRR